MWSVLIPIAVREPAVPELAAATPNYAGYGEGWALADYRGDKLVSHTGGWLGMVSRVTMIPSRRIGVIVLTNGESGAAFNAITWRALDAMTAAPVTDWTAAYALARAKEEANADTSWQQHSKLRDKATKPSLALASSSGRCVTVVRRLVVEQRGDALRCVHKLQPDRNAHAWQHDTFMGPLGRAMAER